MLKINPVMQKDLRITSRNARFYWGLFAYEAILAIGFYVVFKIVLGINSYNSRYNDVTDVYRSFISFFPALMAIQAGIITIIIPVMTGSAITDEKGHQTFDILRTTPLSCTRIVTGKIMSSVIRTMTFVIAGIPIMAFSFIVGGLNWIHLPIFLLITIVYSFMLGSLGVMCSAYSKKTTGAIVKAYIIYILLYVLSFIPFGFGHLYASKLFSYFFLCANPIVLYVNFLMAIVGEESIFAFLYEYPTNGFPVVMSSFWVTTAVSLVIMILLSILYIKIASRKINPLKGKE